MRSPSIRSILIGRNGRRLRIRLGLWIEQRKSESKSQRRDAEKNNRERRGNKFQRGNPHSEEAVSKTRRSSCLLCVLSFFLCVSALAVALLAVALECLN